MRVALLLTLVSACGQATEPEIKRLDGSVIATASLDANVLRLMRAAQVTGVGLGIFSQGRLAYLKTYGFRDREKNLPLTVESVLAGASFTKAAFATLVMQLVEKRTLELDKPVHEYLPKPLPEYSAWRDLSGDDRYKRITARMLLSHTSGFPTCGG